MGHKKGKKGRNHTSVSAGKKGKSEPLGDPEKGDSTLRKSGKKGGGNAKRNFQGIVGGERGVQSLSCKGQASSGRRTVRDGYRGNQSGRKAVETSRVNWEKTLGQISLENVWGDGLVLGASGKIGDKKYGRHKESTGQL